MSKPTFYTAFANSVNEKDFLPNLSEEALKIADLLQKLAFEDRLYFIKDEIFDLDRLIMNFSKYGERFDHFYFSGHGKEGCLKLTDNFNASLVPMANVINVSLKNLQLGFFNACETFDLAREILFKRDKTRTTDKLVLIACRNEVNTFLAERFATLFFTQIGQPGTYKDAYEQAKSLVCLMNSKVRFREFYNLADLEKADADFEYAYMEINFVVEKNLANPTHVEPPTQAVNKKQAATSVIGDNKILNDALTANYLREVVETLSGSPMEHNEVTVLSDALKAAKDVSGGVKMNATLSKIFKKAADALPGLSSPATFQSLINVEKNRNNPSVQRLVKTGENTAIGNLVEVVSSIRL